MSYSPASAVCLKNGSRWQAPFSAAATARSPRGRTRRRGNGRLSGGGVADVLLDRVAERAEEACVRVREADVEVVSEARRTRHGARHVARVAEPDDEIAENADRVAAERPAAAPRQRDPHLVVRVRRQARIGVGVIRVPDLGLLDELVVLRRDRTWRSGRAAAGT